MSVGFVGEAGSTAGLPPLVIVSGGQSGADRAALDFALAAGIPHAGWCPRGRLAEDGPIDARYCLREASSSGPAERTRLNVEDSDGTVLFSSSGRIDGGSLLTMELAERMGRPRLHLSAELAVRTGGERLASFVREGGIRILNVAGPRHSKEPQVAEQVRAVLETATELLGIGAPRSAATFRDEHDRVSIWLLPEARQRRLLEERIAEAAQRCGGHCFAPHLTLLVGSLENYRSMEGALLQRMRSCASLELSVRGMETSAELRRPLFLRLEESPALVTLKEHLGDTAAGLRIDLDFPHLSLGYAPTTPKLVRDLYAHSASELERIAFDAFAVVSMPHRAGQRIDPTPWRVLAEMPMRRT